jgi:hypothetical protein
MIVKMGAVVSQASGSIGGLTFANRKGSPVCQLKGRQCDKKTDAQITHQAAHAATARAWQNLSGGARFQWHLYALKNTRLNRLGVQRKMTGYQFYMKENCLLRQIGGTPRTTPPLKGQCGAGYPAVTIFYAGGPYTLEMSPPATDTTGWYAIYGARPHKTVNTGRLFPRLVHAEYVSGYTVFDLFTPWTDIFGLMASSELYWLGIRYIGSNSLTSALLSYTQVVA